MIIDGFLNPERRRCSRAILIGVIYIGLYFIVLVLRFRIAHFVNSA